MIFRKMLDQTGIWLMAELPAWDIFHGVERGCRKKEKKRRKRKHGQLKHLEHLQVLKWSWHICGSESIDACVLPLPSAHAFTFNFSPILPLLCYCFLQCLSTSFILPLLLITGTPQRWRIIPVRSSKSFMSWEDTLVRVLPVLFPLYWYLDQLPSLAVSRSLSIS